jgi:hypothetical protein
MMRRYFSIVAALALMIPGLAGAEVNLHAQVSSVPAVTDATLPNFDGSTPSLSTVQPVPEPTTRALIACGLAIGFLVLNRKHTRKS